MSLSPTERIQQELYGTGFHDGYIHRKDEADRMAREAPLTRSDWWLWAAALLGFVLGAAA